MSTLLHRLHAWATATPKSPAQWYKQDGRWVALSAGELWQRTFHLALFLENRGFKAGEVSTIFSYNCPQWVQTELAVVLLGGMSAGIYPNSARKDIQYVVDNTQSAVLAVQNRDYFTKTGFAETGAGLPSHVRLLLVFEGEASFCPQAVSYGQALEEGSRLARDKRPETYLERLQPEDSAFLIYTSGTTGNPKGAILSHDNMVFISDQIIAHGPVPAAGRMFSFLPLCHIAEKLQNLGVGISARYAVYYCSKFENVATEMPEVRPTLLLCVPRLWEKIMEGVLGKIADGKPAKRALARWALAIGKRTTEVKDASKRPDLLLRLKHMVAEKLVLLPIRRKLGLDAGQLFASGAAPLHPNVSRWFRALGIEIREAFGQTESTGVICLTERGVESAGTVGKALPGVEFRLAEDGEIQTQGRHVFKGYLHNEDATRATVLDGWLHTGDLGEINERGMVRIIGRKKEIMKSSGGKMIAPVPVEEKIKESPHISQACMVGDGRKYFTALVVLKDSVLTANKLPGEGDSGVARIAPALSHSIRQHIDHVNRQLACYEQIKHFAILARDFSVESGELTPTLKMKRNAIEKRYHAIIERLYQEIEQEESERPPHSCPISCSPEICFCQKQGVQVEICQTRPDAERQ